PGKVTAVSEGMIGTTVVGNMAVGSVGGSITTIPGTTTTTIPGTTTTTIPGTTTTTIPGTTTTVVAAPGGGGTGGGGGTTGGGGGALSRTGVDSARMAWLAGLALLMGLWLVRAARRAPSWGHSAMGNGVTGQLRRSLASGAHRFGRRRLPWEKRGRR
ncbi:MAG: hypothetical protein ACR2HV_03115, partial [Acidimicrobiales bacterium]